MKQIITAPAVSQFGSCYLSNRAAQNALASVYTPLAAGGAAVIFEQDAYGAGGFSLARAFVITGGGHDSLVNS